MTTEPREMMMATATEKTTIRVVTAAGTKASQIGEVHTAVSGSWRNSVDRCDSDGHGRVFIDCDPSDAEYIEEALDADDDVISYDRV